MRARSRSRTDRPCPAPRALCDRGTRRPELSPPSLRILPSVFLGSMLLLAASLCRDSQADLCWVAAADGGLRRAPLIGHSRLAALARHFVERSARSSSSRWANRSSPSGSARGLELGAQPRRRRAPRHRRDACPVVVVLRLGRLRVAGPGSPTRTMPSGWPWRATCTPTSTCRWCSAFQWPPTPRRTSSPSRSRRTAGSWAIAAGPTWVTSPRAPSPTSSATPMMDPYSRSDTWPDIQIQQPARHRGPRGRGRQDLRRADVLPAVARAHRGRGSRL